MENIDQLQLKELLVQYGRAIFIVAVLCLLFIGMAHAADTTDIPELNTQGSAAITVLKFVAKWGGVAAIVLSVIAIGMGKAKGETAHVLCALAIMIGGLGAAWGFFTTSFTQGFMF